MKITMWGLLIDDSVPNDNCISINVGMEAVQEFIRNRHDKYGWEAPVDNICDKVAYIFNIKKSKTEYENYINRVKTQIADLTNNPTKSLRKKKPKWGEYKSNKSHSQKRKKVDPNQLTFNF